MLAPLKVLKKDDHRQTSLAPRVSFSSKQWIVKLIADSALAAIKMALPENDTGEGKSRNVAA
jgi:hypothetical protein